jgi:hypothetical protein
MMRWVLMIGGVVLAVVGTIWLLQGLNLLPGSFMTGQTFWAWAGLLTLVVGIGLLFAGARHRGASR